MQYIIGDFLFELWVKLGLPKISPLKLEMDEFLWCHFSFSNLIRTVLSKSLLDCHLAIGHYLRIIVHNGSGMPDCGHLRFLLRALRLNNDFFFLGNQSQTIRIDFLDHGCCVPQFDFTIKFYFLVASHDEVVKIFFSKVQKKRFLKLNE